MKLFELAKLTGARLEGITDDVEITGAAGLDEAGEGHVTFLANPRYTPRVNTTRASAIYLSEDAKTEREISILRVKDPYLAYTRALRIFHPEAELEPSVHPSAVIDPTARIAAKCVCWRGSSHSPKCDRLRRCHNRKKFGDSFRRRAARTHSHR
jgi:UDP-3-O-[3-hydroxymyristoyl] glucosamine N-acyltransferase